jgi:hypothetical protein
VDTVITHPDGIFSKGGSFELGLRAFETQIPNPAFGLLNFADLDLIGYVPVALLQKDTNFPQSRVRWSLDSVIVTGVDLGMPNTGDTLSYVYTLTLDGTTHGFERGYDAFLGDPFGVDVVTENLGVAVTPVTGRCRNRAGSGSPYSVSQGGASAGRHEQQPGVFVRHPCRSLLPILAYSIAPLTDSIAPLTELAKS